MNFHMRGGIRILGFAIAMAMLSGFQGFGAEPEWTYERAAREWRPMTRGFQHVGVPGYQFQAAVLWNGALYFGPEKDLRSRPGLREEVAEQLGDNVLHVSFGYGQDTVFPERLGATGEVVTKNLEDGFLPIPYVRTRQDGLEWEERVFAHLLDRPMEEGMRPKTTDVLIVYSQIEVVNTTSQPRNVSLWMHFGDGSQVKFGYKSGQGPELGPALFHEFRAPFGLVGGKVRYILPPVPQGKFVWHDAVSAPKGMDRPGERMIEWRAEIPANGKAGLKLIIPYRPVDRATAERLLKADFGKVHQEVRDFYLKLATGIGRISTPEPFINEYLKAVSGQITQQIAYRHAAKYWMYKTSPNHYEYYWPCNGAKALPTLDLRGLTEYSEPVLQSFVDTQTDDYGALTHELSGKAVSGDGFARVPGFMGNFREWTANTLLLSHGLEMWALASHYRITRDSKWLGEGPGSVLQSLLDAFNWVAEQRKRTMRSENGQKVPSWGLLPAASAHDWLSGNTIFNDAFCIYGMTETVRLLRDINHPRAEELARELNDYRACLRQRYVEARDRARPVPLADGSSLPYVPRDVYELDWAKVDWTYSGFSPTRAGAWGVLDPHDELVNQSLTFLMEGMPKGDGFYIKHIGKAFDQPNADVNFDDVSDPKADRHYLWRHFVEYETMWPIGADLFLQRDELPQFFEWLYNNLAVVLHHDYRVGVESLDGVPSNAPGDAERWRAVRNMFVNERGGYDGSRQSLWLLQAIPRAWMKPGNRFGVEEMGTHFGGRVDLNTTVTQDGSAEVTLELRLATQPTEIRMRLRSGDGRPLRKAEINGSETAVLEGDTIRLPPEMKGKYRIVGRF